MMSQTKKLLTSHGLEEVSTCCPSEDWSPLQDFLEDPENVATLNECLPEAGQGDIVQSHLKSSLKLCDAVLDDIRAQKESEAKVFESYGEEADGLRLSVATLDEKVGIFTGETMSTTTKVQRIVVELRLGLQFLKTLKAESFKGDSTAADKSRLSELAQKAVEHLERGRMTDQLIQELQTLTSSSNDLMTQAVAVKREMEDLVARQAQVLEQTKAAINKKYQTEKARRAADVERLAQQVEEARQKKDDAWKEVDDAKQHVQSREEDMRKMQEMYEAKEAEVAGQREELWQMKAHAKRTCWYGTVLTGAALLALGIATVATGGAAGSALVAWVAFTSTHMANIATAAAAGNAAYLIYQESGIRSMMAAERKPLEEAVQLKQDSEEAYKTAAVNMKKLEEELLEAASLSDEKFEEAKREEERMLQKQALEHEQAEAEMRAMQGQIQELERKLKAANDLTSHYKAFVEKLDKLKLPQQCMIVVELLHGLGVLPDEVLATKERTGTDAEFVMALATEFSDQKIDETIEDLDDLARKNNVLARKARKMFDAYYGLSGDDA